MLVHYTIHLTNYWKVKLKKYWWTYFPIHKQDNKLIEVVDIKANLPQTELLNLDMKLHQLTVIVDLPPK